MSPEARACSGCGATMPPEARFCASCGARAPLVIPQTLDQRLADTTPSSDLPLPVARIPNGTVIPPGFVIEGVAGEGGMGVVYRAYDRVLDRTVAIKCLHANLAADAEVRRRFLREARLLRAWIHPNVVAIYDFLERDQLLAIVMEFVEGATLAEHIRTWRGRVPFVEAARILADVLEAMEESHRRGVVHRDLKPANILLVSDGTALRPKIVDFGIAKMLEGTTFTMSGALLGTCCYMSPEQIQRPGSADPRSDIYSLGVTLYETCAGRPPFEDENHFALMMAHVTKQPPPPSMFRADVPPALEQLILDALAKEPARRPVSCAEFRERLLAAVPDAATRPSETTRRELPMRVREADGESILVPAGPFKMGAARREVYLDAFYVDRAPVTNAQFARFVGATGYRPDDANASRFLAHWKGGSVPRGLEQHPVVYVSWLDATAYAAWAGRRLPSEAEWEKAARGTDGRRYPWGNDEPTADRANFGRRARGTSPVGSYPNGASPYGVEDLAGNVLEWCDDVDDPEFYASGPSHNPHRTLRSPDAKYVMRGGAWMYGPRAMRTDARTSFDPHYRFASGGFRCVRGA